MSKILVTGAGGFVGSHLTEYLVRQGYKVKAFIRYNSCNFREWLDKSKYINDIEIYSGDIRDYDSVYNSIKGIDYVFHLAALIVIPHSYYSPLDYIKTNIEGTYNILQAAKELNIKRIIHISTSAVYGTAQYIPIDEKHPINPQSPYAASKAGADHLTKSFYLSFNLPVTIVRPFNMFGPRQSAQAVIPTIITQILDGKGYIKLGNLNSSRDFNYILDAVEGISRIGLHPNTIGKVINIGTGKDLSIRKLTEIVNKLTGKNSEIKLDNKRARSPKSEVWRSVCDYSNARNLTGWKPRYTFEKGLEETINWFNLARDPHL